VETADVCLFLEGTYPYVSGGVSNWVHQLILSQPNLTFHLVCIVPKETKQKEIYEIPINVLSISKVSLQELIEGDISISKAKQILFFNELEIPLIQIFENPQISTLRDIIEILKKYHCKCGRKFLLDSPLGWEMMIRIYKRIMSRTSFLTFFWSYRSLMSGLFSILAADIPPAKLYHTLCTGFAGLFLARVRIEKNAPCITTEHGIYTNERRIEIASATWLDNFTSQNFNVDYDPEEKEIKDYWINTFGAYSKFCYEASDKIITLFEGNQSFQINDGADQNKMLIIPNGIDYDKYSSIKKNTDHPPTVALIGRVVPIKDIKCFIRSIKMAAEEVPNLRAYVIGSTDEDKEYYEECLELIENESLKGTITLTGKVDIADYLPEIDVMVLTSLSEGQPLTILEAGAAGIPSVATDVGACSEIIYGKSDDKADGGIIVPLANPSAVAEALCKLIDNKEYYQNCCKTIQKRIGEYYIESTQTEKYGDIYQEMIHRS